MLYYCALYIVDRGRGIIIIQSWYSRHRSYSGSGGGRRCIERAGGRKVLALNLSPPGGRDYGGGSTRVLC